jgi:hypothetical protein
MKRQKECSSISRRVSHAKEDEGKQHEEVRVSRGPAGAAAAV